MLALFAAATIAAISPTPEKIAHYEYCEPAVFETWSTSFKADGSTTNGHDRANRFCYYDGRAELAEYRGLNAANQTQFHGVSITIWSEDGNTGRTLWAMVGVDGHTDIKQRWEEGKLVTEGKGHDPQGVFLERSTTTFSPGGDQHFDMERSYDNGASWARFNVLEYLKTPAAPKPLPANWAPQLATVAPGLVAAGGAIILDGFAWGKFIEDANGNPMGYQFASVAPKDNAWFWRTLTWTFANGVVDVVDVPMN